MPPKRDIKKRKKKPAVVETRVEVIDGVEYTVSVLQDAPRATRQRSYPMTPSARKKLRAATNAAQRRKWEQDEQLRPRDK